MVNATLSKNMGGTTTSQIGAGATCIDNLPFTPVAALATQRNFSFGGEVDVGVAADNVGACPAGTDARVQSYNSSGTIVDRKVLVVFWG